MRYPVAVWETDGVFSAEIPDLPGAITQADSLDELGANAKEAATLWLECVLDDGGTVPKPTDPERLRGDDAYKDARMMLIDIDLSALSDKVERLNICLPSRALRRLDILGQKGGKISVWILGSNHLRNESLTSGRANLERAPAPLFSAIEGRHRQQLLESFSRKSAW